MAILQGCSVLRSITQVRLLYSSAVFPVSEKLIIKAAKSGYDNLPRAIMLKSNIR